MPRYAILTHDHPFLHWDLLLEDGETLRTWRLLAPPAPAAVISAEPLPPHRKLYLDYEGPVSGDRGRVTRWDGGEFETLQASRDELRIRLRGARFSGIAVLTAAEAGRWTVHFSEDSSAGG